MPPGPAPLPSELTNLPKKGERMGQRGPAPKPTNLMQLYRAHERRVPIDERGG
jgi:hypothetical protein